MPPRRAADYSRVLRLFEEWLRSEKLPLALSTITRRECGRYVTARALANDNPKTANKNFSALRSYWKWLARKGLHTGENPWALQSLKVPRAKTKRPFTDDELKKLLKGGADQALLDAIKILSLSGLRCAELAKLTVERTGDGVFRVIDAKTPSGDRAVPIHSALREIVARRRKGKEPSDYLFDETPNHNGQFFTKEFRKYRLRIGIHEQVNEMDRQSKVDLHSLRRWFITKADRAGNRREDVERVVGHKVQGMSFGLYSGGSSLDQLRRVVESVRLPV
jgi:integrase